MVIEAVNAKDLQMVWDVFPALQEQTHGGLKSTDLPLSPGADIPVLIRHCAVLQKRFKPGDSIDFDEAAKAIELP